MTTLVDRLAAITGALPDRATVTLEVGTLREWVQEQIDLTDGRDMTVEQVGARMECTGACVRKWIRAEKLEAYKLEGKAYRVTPAALAAFRDAQRNPVRRAASKRGDISSWRKVMK